MMTNRCLTDVNTLRKLEWIRRRENLMVCGPRGTGKTFILRSLSQQAAEAGMHVFWFALNDLKNLGVFTRSGNVISTTASSDLIVVDGIGVQVGVEEAEGFRRLLAGATRAKCSILVSSILCPDSFNDLMPPTLADTIDQLLRHGHLYRTTSDGGA